MHHYFQVCEFDCTITRYDEVDWAVGRDNEVGYTARKYDGVKCANRSLDMYRWSGRREGGNEARRETRRKKQPLSSKERKSNRQRRVRDPTEGICVDEIKEAGNNTMDANQTGVWFDRGQQRVALQDEQGDHESWIPKE